MYMALYRKWRPKLFEDIYGQEQITITLKNELKDSKLSHAYLFCGTRGTGKTTTAKLLAKAINCKQPNDGNPCDTCDSCISINEGNSIDVFEIDAASNRGIDDIRELKEAIKYTPTMGKYKVYIIDEVHMLTNEAFNALLKTLEEPPEYVLFILATTEPHKLPATILSRCQRFDFKRISVENIIKRLQLICSVEGLEIDEAALRLIARNSDGALRDAISLLEQCAVYGTRSIQYDEVLEVLGIVNNEILFGIGEAILTGDASKAILLINELSAGGKDIYQFIRDLTVHYRNLLMTKVVDKPEDVIDMSKEGITLLKKHADAYSKDNIIRCIHILSNLENEAKWVANPRILLEIAVIKMCKTESDQSIEGLLARLSNIEQAVSSGKLPSNRKSSNEGENTNRIKDKIETEKPEKQKHGTETKLKPKAEASEVIQKWNGFIQELKSKGKIKLRTYLALAKPTKFESGQLFLSFSKEDAHIKEAVEGAPIKNEIEAAAAEFYGITVRIRAAFEGEENIIDKKSEEIDIVETAIALFGQDKVEVIEEE